MSAIEKPPPVSASLEASRFLEYEFRPFYMLGAVFRLNGLSPFMIKAPKSKPTCKFYRFVARNLEHTAPWWDRAVALAHRNSAACREQLSQIGHACISFAFGQMHPDRVHEDKIICLSARDHMWDAGQYVIEPLDLRGSLAAPSLSSSVGSTARTECPSDANQAASRPVPAPMSRMRAGVCGNR